MEGSLVDTKEQLCCQVNPCYICAPCGYRECQDHWEIRESQGGPYHFSADRVCRVTGLNTLPRQGEEGKPATWHEIKEA